MSAVGKVSCRYTALERLVKQCEVGGQFVAGPEGPRLCGLNIHFNEDWLRDALTARGKDVRLHSEVPKWRSQDEAVGHGYTYGLSVEVDEAGALVTLLGELTDSAPADAGRDVTRRK